MFLPLLWSVLVVNWTVLSSILDSPLSPLKLNLSLRILHISLQMHSHVTLKRNDHNNVKSVNRQLSCLYLDVPVVRGVSPSRRSQDSRGSSRIGSTEEDLPVPPSAPSIQTSRVGSPLLDYPTYMARFLASEQPSPFPSPHLNSTETSPTKKVRVISCDHLNETSRNR